MNLFVNIKVSCATIKKLKERKHIMLKMELAATCSTFLLEKNLFGNVKINLIIIQLH